MGDLLNFNDHIDKTQNKQRYLGYEKGKVIESVIESFIAEIPDIPEEKLISYFTKIVKKQISLFDDTYFDSRYMWNANYLKYKTLSHLEEGEFVFIEGDVLKGENVFGKCNKIN